MDEPLSILFADAMPSPLMVIATSRVFGASLAWSLELLPPAGGAAGDGWWRADTELTGNADGYANQVSTVWTPRGEPAAISHQLVAVYGSVPVPQFAHRCAHASPGASPARSPADWQWSMRARAKRASL